MDSFIQVGWEIVRLMPLVVNPAVSPFFWPVVLIVYFQYRRIARMEKDLYGRVFNPALPSTFSAALYGLIGGFTGSLILVSLGVSLRQGDVIFLLPVALLLMLIHPRLLCFSYAGGLLSVSYLVIGWPEINVPALMGLVAVLHLVEGLLVLTGGAQCRTPLFVRTDSGRVVGGFSLQRFWPLPLVVLLLLQLDPSLVTEGVDMPSWWPLIAAPAPDASGRWVHVMFPVAAALGYADIALTSQPGRKARASARHLGLYSVALLAASVLAARIPAFLWVAALVGPGAHELMVIVGSRREQRGRPRFASPARGVMVLHTLRDSPASRMGVRPGDVILNVGGQPVNSRPDLKERLDQTGYFLDLEILRGKRLVDVFQRWSGGSYGSLGIVAVPDPGDSPHVILGSRSGLALLMDRFRSRRGKNDEDNGG